MFSSYEACEQAHLCEFGVNKLRRGNYPARRMGRGNVSPFLGPCPARDDGVTLITPRQNVYAWASLRISGLFFSRTFQSDQSLSRALGFILCAACGSVVLLHATRVFDCFVLIEIAFMDNQVQITETISRLDSEKVS